MKRKEEARIAFVRGYCCAVSAHLRGHGSNGDVYATDMLRGVSRKDIEAYADKLDVEVFRQLNVLP